MDDRQIVQLYLARNEQAIAETDVKYGVRIRGLIFRILRNEEDSEEVRSDTWMQAWGRIPPAEPYDYLFAFLAKIARHLSFDRIRRQNAQKRSAELVELSAEMQECLGSGEDAAQAVVDDLVLGEVLNTFLKELPAESRCFFIRRYFFMDGIREIAQAAGVSESKVKVTLHRLRGKLRTKLEAEGFAG